MPFQFLSIFPLKLLPSVLRASSSLLPSTFNLWCKALLPNKYCAGTRVVREGLPSNERGLQVLKKHGIVSNHRARQVNEDDFRRFDVMLAFDEGNVRGLNETFKPNDGTARLHVFIK